MTTHMFNSRFDRRTLLKGAAALGAAPLVPGLLAPCFLRSGKFSDQIVQLLAGHARQRRM